MSIDELRDQSFYRAGPMDYLVATGNSAGAALALLQRYIEGSARSMDDAATELRNQLRAERKKNFDDFDTYKTREEKQLRLARRDLIAREKLCKYKTTQIVVPEGFI